MRGFSPKLYVNICMDVGRKKILFIPVGLMPICTPAVHKNAVRSMLAADNDIKKPSRPIRAGTVFYIVLYQGTVQCFRYTLWSKLFGEIPILERSVEADIRIDGAAVLIPCLGRRYSYDFMKGA